MARYWNVMHTGVFMLLVTEKAKPAVLIGFVEDLAVIVKADDAEIFVREMVKVIKTCLVKPVLTLAAENTKSVLITNRRNVPGGYS